MKIGDLFKIKVPGRNSQEVIYEAIVVTQSSNWVSAKVVHPTYLANKLKYEGVFKIDISTLEITIIGNWSDEILQALYG